MPRKVFLSFLGNNVYQPARYILNGEQSGVVRFVQEALLTLECGEWITTDEVLIFLTPEAEKNNWRGDFYEGKGLKQSLSAHPHLLVRPVRKLPKGVSEAEIWSLFNNIYQSLLPQDEVYLDITNGFRSLPMLLMVLLDYAKALKKIRVQKIYYGAFEVLGRFSEVVKNYPNPAERVVPILDLSSFAALQDWTTAAADFHEYGRVQRLSDLINNNKKSVFKRTANLEELAAQLQQIDQYIQALTPAWQTNRGRTLKNFQFEALQTALTQLYSNEQMMAPLTPIIQKMHAKIAHFRDKDPLFWLKSAHWCHQHGLIQQSITQLHEGFITWLCFRFRQMTGDDFFDAHSGEARNLVNSVFTVIEKNIPERKWRNAIGRNKPYAKIMLQDSLVQQAVPTVGGMNNLRNDINHGGYVRTASAATFEQQLADYLTTIAALVTTPDVVYPTKNTNGLLNVSHHPFAHWSTAQRQLAQQQFGSVRDLAFPEVDAALSPTAFNALVEQYYRQIKQLRPQAVHIMGELTFTYALVRRLKGEGVVCLASVVHRQIGQSEDRTIDYDFRKY
ncbi:MAG: TIGR02221 family CRISPR-associated protein [Bacteroidota bacterium]